MRVKHTIKGHNELVAKFRVMEKAVAADKLEAAATAGIKPIENAAISIAPFQSGTLRRSIHTETLEKRAAYAEVATGTDVVYAARIEFGFDDFDILGRLYNQPAQPFMRPAYDERMQDAIDETANALRDLILNSASI